MDRWAPRHSWATPLNIPHPLRQTGPPVHSKASSAPLDLSTRHRIGRGSTKPHKMPRSEIALGRVHHGSWSDGEKKERRLVPATHKESHSVMFKAFHRYLRKNTQKKTLNCSDKRQDIRIWPSDETFVHSAEFLG